MKNIQISDDAESDNSEFFQATEQEFNLIFSSNSTLAFIDDVYKKGDAELLNDAFKKIWDRRIKSSDVNGIHGTLYLT